MIMLFLILGLILKRGRVLFTRRLIQNVACLCPRLLPVRQEHLARSPA